MTVFLTSTNRYYTKEGFIPNDSFRLFTEECEVQIESFQRDNSSVVREMISAFEKTGTEFEAGKILFENLKLSPKQASDIGFWTYHNHYTFYPYIAKRWRDLWENKENVTNPSSYIINHWVQSNTSQGELIDYPISGLWWSFYLTVDESRTDKYELTKILFKNFTLRTKQLGSARFSRHKPAMLGVLEFIKERIHDSQSLERAARAIVPYINLLGGIRPLTYFDKDWFKGKLESRFGQQITAGEKLFIRPEENQEILSSRVNEQNSAADIISIPTTARNLDEISVVVAVAESSIVRPEERLTLLEYGREEDVANFERYFCLNSASGEYCISSTFQNNWDYCIGIDFSIQNQFLIHFYQEGKIKKSRVNGKLSNRKVDREIYYQNGKCKRLTLSDVKLINKPVLFGIAYKIRGRVYFKAMDEQDTDNFRVDNPDLHQEGKQVHNINEPFKSAYKILPYEIKEVLGTLVQQSATGRGADITSRHYSERWNILREHWSELFDNSLKWSDEVTPERAS